MSRHRNIRGLARDWSEYDDGYDDEDYYSEEEQDDIDDLIEQIKQVLGFIACLTI